VIGIRIPLERNGWILGVKVRQRSKPKPFFERRVTGNWIIRLIDFRLLEEYFNIVFSLDLINQGKQV
jgi:hypothetical protein